MPLLLIFMLSGITLGMSVLKRHLGETPAEIEITLYYEDLLAYVLHAMINKCWNVCPYLGIAAKEDKCMNKCVLKNIYSIGLYVVKRWEI